MRLQTVSPETNEIANSWRSARGISEIPPETLSAEGQMAFRDDGRPIACAWLYIDGGFGYLAWSVTNPEATPREAHRGLELVARELIARGQKRGVRYIVAMSAYRGLTKLLVRCGMTLEPKSHDILSLEVR